MSFLIECDKCSPIHELFFFFFLKSQTTSYQKILTFHGDRITSKSLQEVLHKHFYRKEILSCECDAGQS